MILIKINRDARIEINCDNLNCLLSTIFAADIAKMLCIHNFLLQNKYLV